MTTQGKNLIFHSSLGDVVKAWREKRGWLLTELAARSGTSKGYISGLENNKTHQPNELKEIEEKWREAEQKYEAEKQEETKSEGGFEFESPVEPSARRKKKNKKEDQVSSHPASTSAPLNEDAQLRLILNKLEELQILVEEYILQKGKQS